ncbi:partial Phosphate acetyltransferase, partial [Gammaproteobacteria bacterium]
MRTTVLVAPAGRGVGLTTACLGIVRALDREGIRVAFAKPVANREPDHTIPLLSLGAHFAIPPAVPRAEAEGLLADGDDQTLMERVVAIADQAGEDVDVLIVQGMHPEMGMVHSARVNALMLKALDAELVLVAAPSDQTAAEVAESIAIAARGYGALSDGRNVGAILNRVCDRKGVSPEPEADSFGPSSGGCGACAPEGLSETCLKEHQAALEAEGLRPIAIVPCNADLMSPRVKDIGDALRAQFLYTGDSVTRRVRDVAICAMTVPNAMKAMRPGTLVLTPGDRSDILLAAA